jgi:hypothetical protein
MMIFVYIYSTSSVAEPKTRMESWNARNDVSGVYCFHLLFNNCFGLAVSTMGTNCPSQVFYVWLVDLQSICAKYRLEHDSLEIMILVYVCSTSSVVELKTLFETWIARNDVNGVYWFHLSYLITVWALDNPLKCAYNGHQFSKSSIVCLTGRSTDYLY